MVPLLGKPVLAYLLEWAVKSRFAEVVLLCGYKHQIISDYFGDGHQFGIPISYSIEPKPLGSGGPIKYAQNHLKDTFAYISGDLICQIDFKAMLDAHLQTQATMSVALHVSSHPDDSDILQIDKHHRVTKFVSKHADHTNAGNLSNAGLCILEPRVLDYMDQDVFTFETYLYPKLLEAGEYVNAYVTEEYIHDMGTPERLRDAEHFLVGE
jgi:NDP-sugar pyrophosphorylase family protein